MTAHNPDEGETPSSQDSSSDAEQTQNHATLVFNCGYVPSFEDGTDLRVMTDGGRDTHHVRYVEYQGEGYRVQNTPEAGRLILDQPHEPLTEAPIDECTPTDVWGNPLDTDDLILEPRRVWSEYNDYDDFGGDDDGPDRRVMTDGGRDTEPTSNGFNSDAEFAPNNSDDSNSSDIVDAFPSDDDDSNHIMGSDPNYDASEELTKDLKELAEEEAREDASEVDGSDSDRSGFPAELVDDVPSVTELRSLWRATPGNHPEEWVRTQTMVTRYAVARTCDYIEANHDIIFIGESDEKLPALYLYNPETGLYEDEAEKQLRELVEELLPVAGDDGTKDAVISKLEDRNVVDIESLNARNRDHTYRCVRNGVLDINTWELHDHDPEWHMVTRLEADWDPDVDVTEMMDFLESIIPEKYIDTVVELLGDILTDHYESQVFPILYGPSNSGKSKLLAFIRLVLGDGNHSGETLRAIATGNWASASLVNGVGVLANLADEVEGARIEHTGQLKALVGGQEMEHQNKFGDPFYKKNTAKPWNVTNHPPVIEDEQEAIANRLIPIECPYVFTSDPDPENPYERQKIPGIIDQIDTPENRAAMLQIMAEGLDRLRDQDWNVSLDETPDERLTRYNKVADAVYSFGVDCLYETNAVNQYDGRDVYLLKQEVFNMYLNYCDAKGVSPLDYEVFFRKLNSGGSVAYGVMDSPGKTLPSGDRAPALTGICPTSQGWEFVARDKTRERFADEVGENQDVPMPGDDGDDDPASADVDASSTAAGTEIAADGGADASTLVTSVIAQLEMGDASTATYAAISTKVGMPSRPEEKRLSPGEVEETIEKLLRDGTIEFDAKTASYRTTTGGDE